METIRNEVANALNTVTPEAAPRVYEAIQSELGYKHIEDKAINMMIDNRMTASATIPHIENEL
jgi:hypothetical protein